jgi:hypothetical protein
VIANYVICVANYVIWAVAKWCIISSIKVLSKYIIWLLANYVIEILANYVIWVLVNYVIEVLANYVRGHI